MISPGFLEILMSLVGVHLLVLRSVEHGVGFLQHRDDRQDLAQRDLGSANYPAVLLAPDSTHLVGAPERLALDDRLGQLWIHRELCHSPS